MRSSSSPHTSGQAAPSDTSARQVLSRATLQQARRGATVTLGSGSLQALLALADPPTERVAHIAPVQVGADHPPHVGRQVQKQALRRSCIALLGHGGPNWQLDSVPIVQG